MLLNPIIERELKIALRVRQAAKSRFRTAMFGAICVGVMLLIQLITGGHSIGRTLERWLFYGGIYLTVWPALSISSDMFAAERRNHTLELLYLTGMNEGELFLGKLMGGVLVASSDLLALAPMLAVPFLCGGISFDLFLATIACFPILLLFVLSVGTLGSVLNTDEGSAQVTTVTMGALVAFALPLPFYMGQMIRGVPPFSAGWLCLSPAYGPYLVWTYFGKAARSAFWTASGISILWSVFFLLASAFVLRRNWRSELEKKRSENSAGVIGLLERKGLLARSKGPNRIFSSNPFQWLVERDKRTPILAIGLLAGISLLWVGCWALWRHAWFSTLNLLLTAAIMLLATYWLELFAAARRLGEDRRDGVLELLLTTPLGPKDIVEGQLEGVRAQFREVRYIRFGLFSAMMVAGFFSRKWTGGAIASYIMIWTILLVSSLHASRKSLPAVLWISLNSGRPLWSVTGSRRNSKFANIYNLFNLFRFLPALGVLIGTMKGFPTGHPLEICILALLFVIWAAVLGSGRYSSKDDPMRIKLIGEMRSIAETPVPDPKDPRFEKWNTKERFH